MIRVLLALVAMFTLAGSLRAAEPNKAEVDDITTEQLLEEAGKRGLLNPEPKPRDFEAIDRLNLGAMEAAFDCANLAAFAPKDSDEAKELRRLFGLGVSSGRLVMPKVRAKLGEDEAGPEAIMALFLNQTDDFWLGTFYSQSAQRIERLVREETPSAEGLSYESWVRFRGTTAQAEFRKRNCALIGPR